MMVAARRAFRRETPQSAMTPRVRGKRILCATRMMAILNLR
jgi:hypothetical protein